MPRVLDSWRILSLRPQPKFLLALDELRVAGLFDTSVGDNCIDSGRAQVRRWATAST